MDKDTKLSNTAENNNKIALVEPLIESLNSHVGKLLTEIAEVGLDTLLDEGVLKSIPIVSSVVSVYKIGHSIKELPESVKFSFKI